MSVSMARAAVMLGLGVLMLGTLFTPLINAGETDAVAFTELDNGTSDNVTDYLSVEVVNVNASNSSVKLQDLKTLNSTQDVINEKQNKTFSLSGEQIHVNNTVLVDSDTAQYRVQYAPTFGYNDFAAVFFQNIGLIIAIVGLVLVMGAVVVAFS